MRWSWSVVAGLCALASCAPEDDSAPAWAYQGNSTPARSPARVTVEPGMVRFPSTTVGSPAMASVRLRNEGETPTQVLLGIPEPFTVESASLYLAPGAEHTVSLRLDPPRSGTTGGVLLVRFEDRRIEIAVSAEVKPAPEAPGSESLPEAWGAPPPTR